MAKAGAAYCSPFVGRLDDINDIFGRMEKGQIDGRIVITI